MPGGIIDIWQQAAVVAILLAVLWTGHKGWWYWSPGVRALATELARERDDWRALAITLLRKHGIELPEGFEQGASIVLPGREDDDKSRR